MRVTAGAQIAVGINRRYSLEATHRGESLPTRCTAAQILMHLWLCECMVQLAGMESLASHVPKWLCVAVWHVAVWPASCVQSVRSGVICSAEWKDGFGTFPAHVYLRTASPLTAGRHACSDLCVDHSGDCGRRTGRCHVLRVLP